MNKDYLPYYNSLNERDKSFWLECSKEQLIDHLIGNIKNGEELLARINKTIEYINNGIKFETVEKVEGNEKVWELIIGKQTENNLLEILKGEK